MNEKVIWKLHMYTYSLPLFLLLSSSWAVGEAVGSGSVTSGSTCTSAGAGSFIGSGVVSVFSTLCPYRQTLVNSVGAIS